MRPWRDGEALRGIHPIPERNCPDLLHNVSQDRRRHNAACHPCRCHELVRRERAPGGTRRPEPHAIRSDLVEHRAWQTGRDPHLAAHIELAPGCPVRLGFARTLVIERRNALDDVVAELPDRREHGVHRKAEGPALGRQPRLPALAHHPQGRCNRALERVREIVAPTKFVQTLFLVNRTRGRNVREVLPGDPRQLRRRLSRRLTVQRGAELRRRGRPPGGACQYNVVFSPDAVGSAAATSVSSTNAGGFVIELRGTGVTTPPSGSAVTASPIELDFGEVGLGQTSAVQVVNIRNPGDAALGGFAGGAPSHPQFRATQNCAGGVPPGGSCQYNFTFTPAAPGAYEATSSTTTDAGGFVKRLLGNTPVP